MPNDVNSVTESDTAIGRDQRDRSGPYGWRWRFDAGDPCNVRCREGERIDAGTINLTPEEHSIPGLIARSDLHLVRVVDGLPAQARKTVTRSALQPIHIADHASSAIKNHRNMMPLPVIHGCAVSAE